MTSIFESVSNQLSSLPHLIPSFVRKPNENDERIDDLENQIARLDRESKWCDVELDRRIKELTAEVDSLKRTQHHDRSLRTADRVLAIVFMSLAALILVPMFLTLFHVIDPSGETIRWVVFALFAVAIALFVQAMTRNKTVSIITGFVLVIVLGAFYSLNPSALSAAFSALLSGISVFARMDNAYFGILDLQAIVYFLSVAALFVFFTVQSIEKRRWS